MHLQTKEKAGKINLFLDLNNRVIELNFKCKNLLNSKKEIREIIRLR